MVRVRWYHEISCIRATLTGRAGIPDKRIQQSGALYGLTDQAENDDHDQNTTAEAWHEPKHRWNRAVTLAAGRSIPVAKKPGTGKRERAG